MIVSNQKENKMRFKSIASLFLIVSLASCASVPQPGDKTEIQNNDPIESVNRVTFDVNEWLDEWFMKPVAEGYQWIFPAEFRDRITGILSNMKEPVIFANNVLQGKLDSAGTTAERFAINTTVGWGGMFDPATVLNVPQQQGDFGQTLYTYGVSSGPYLVLPLLGPSDLRDAAGLAVDTIASPWQYAAAAGTSAEYFEFEVTDIGMTAVTKRQENLDTIEKLKAGTLDFYANIRSVYQQHRNKELGIATKSPQFEDYDNGIQ